MDKLSKQKTAKILKVAAKNGGRISARDYRDIIKSSAGKEKKPLDLNFSIDVEEVEGRAYILTFYGRHLSTNDINSLPFRDGLRYKSAIKQAARLFFLTNRGAVPKKPLKKVRISPTAYNKRSRDDDGNARTIKILRDLLSTYKFIVDDNRKYLIQEKCEEVLQSEYKLEIRVEEILD